MLAMKPRDQQDSLRANTSPACERVRAAVLGTLLGSPHHLSDSDPRVPVFRVPGPRKESDAALAMRHRRYESRLGELPLVQALRAFYEKCDASGNHSND
ncbi:hypothetical protein IPJ72_02780 [Candidatus Peregrinibacteria bacterium]|nr:MAG: hypothetical protein IPJ72_02780 [Candidatus Peregrinibacteria bacterium]